MNRLAVDYTREAAAWPGLLLINVEVPRHAQRPSLLGEEALGTIAISAAAILSSRWSVHIVAGGGSREKAPSACVGGRLKPIQLRVLTSLRHQCVMRSHFHEARAVEDDDEIGHPDGRESV